jgi:hypothetical protein
MIGERLWSLLWRAAMEHTDAGKIRPSPANQAILREPRIIDVPPTARQRFVRWLSAAPLTLLAMWVFGIVVAMPVLIIFVGLLLIMYLI